MRGREARELIAEFVELGWEDLGQARRGGHWRLRWPPTGNVVTVPGSPSDHRCLRNTRALMRRVMRGVYAEPADANS